MRLCALFLALAIGASSLAAAAAKPRPDQMTAEQKKKKALKYKPPKYKGAKKIKSSQARHGVQKTKAPSNQR